MNASFTDVVHGDIEIRRPVQLPCPVCRIRGWCFIPGQEYPPPVRLRTAEQILTASVGELRNDVPAFFPNEPAAMRSGFTITGRLSAGLHAGCVEAKTTTGDWRAFKHFTIAVSPDDFHASLDEPISHGVLKDRVKVGGWALAIDAPISELSLHYGHRQVACRLNQPRADVAAAFPAVPHAGACGFVSDDFLVAGHGPVRIHARLADGRTIVHNTAVTFSVAADENHPFELDLTAARIALPRCPPAPTGQISTDTRALNVLFVLHGSFAANSALHVTALANELSYLGYECCVAVTHDIETLALHASPRFRGVLHRTVEQTDLFTDSLGPAIIHAWTTRENVRRLTERMRQRHPRAKVIVHLEDNERQILAFRTQRSWEELQRLSGPELDAIVADDLSHPVRSQEFLHAADGITLITESLREFCPAIKPCLRFWPAADARYFYPRPHPRDFRCLLDRSMGETILFYHGNVHAANAAEVRELYLAVVHLNQTGHPTTLIRTGLDVVAFPSAQAPEVAPHVLSLGQIPHHHHLPDLMALADYFVQPGEPDAFNDYRFPSKLPEFFAIGRPVILPRTNLGAALTHRQDAYVLARADAGAIAQAVVTLRTDQILARELAQGALAFAQRHFSWRESALKLANFYAQVAR